MEHPYGKQYGQEGNPRAYMTMRDYRNLELQNQQPVERNPSEYMSMRDYRNLELQNQQPVGRNPNPNMSLREYRDKWMSAPVYHVPSTCPPPPQYDYPEPPFYASPPQSPQSPLSQQPPPLSPVEQAVLNLSKMIGTIQEEQKVLSVQTKQQIEALGSSVNRSLSNLHAEISRLSNQFVHQEEENLEEESQEDECLTETVLVEQAQLQPQEELKKESVEALDEMQDTLESGDTFWPWTKEKEITALLTEKSSEHEGTQEPIIQPNPQAIPIDLDTIATVQATKFPLLVPPSADLVYIQPQPAANSNPAALAPKGKSNPLPAAPPESVFILSMPAAQPKPQASTTKATPSMLVLQNIRRLVASVHAFATTSKTMATAYIAWHSGWFGCGFGFGTPGPRHF